MGQADFDTPPGVNARHIGLYEKVKKKKITGHRFFQSSPAFAQMILRSGLTKVIMMFERVSQSQSIEMGSKGAEQEVRSHLRNALMY